MDNRILTYNTQGGNVANLYQLGEAERMKLMYSYWGEMEEGQSQVTRSQIKDLFFKSTIRRQNSILID